MKNKHIKLYEEHSIEMLMDAIYEATEKKIRIAYRLHEQVVVDDDEYESEFERWLYTDDPIRDGERRARNRGDQVQTKRQYAVVYLAAKGLVDHDDITEYIKIIPGMEHYDFNASNSHIIGAVSNAFGIEKDGTFARTIPKFKNHITGKVEDPEVLLRDADSPKIREYFNRFNTSRINDLRVTPNDLAFLLANAVEEVNPEQIQRRADDIDNRQDLANTRARAAADAIRRRDLKIGTDIHSHLNSLAKEGISIKQASPYVLRRKAQEYPTLSEIQLYEIYANWVGRMPGMRNVRHYINRPNVA